MDLSRRSGVLLHPTSLPGPHGRGDLGPAAYRFVDLLQRGGQAVWQVLPVQPPGFGGSPYAATSAFAGDTLLVSCELLVEDGLLTAEEVADAPTFPEGRVTFEGEAWRRAMLQRAFLRFQERDDPVARQALAAFRVEQSYWLEDHAVFSALKVAHGGGAFWACWPEPIKRHLPGAVRAAREEHRQAIEEEVFAQFLFETQWRRLRAYARERGVELLGDLPIFVARDSSDVWARPELFQLDAEGEPIAVAGVPPDAFSEDGQLWGNPLYDWTVHARTGYGWWIERVRRAFELADMVRIDHFRGFASTWEVPADAETAASGAWVPGPRMALFAAIARELGDLPVVAEDLGEITPDVTELLEASGFPGMKILQFAFYDDDAEHPFRPENQPLECVVYPGTHDNETTAGWFADLDEATRARVVARIDPSDPAWGLIELGLEAPAFLAVFPAQDLLGLGNEARMNTPAVAEGNWGWRLLPEQLDDAVCDRLRGATERHGRLRG